MVSIADIAKELGVSASTVSRVLNGKPYVNAEIKEKVMKKIEEMGYVPNKAARELATARSFNVGIVIPDTFNMFQRLLFSVIERQLDPFGYHTLFFFVKLDGFSEKDCLERMKRERLDGVILLQEIKEPRFYEYLRSSNIPVISTNVNFNNIPTITIDDKKAAYEGTVHLINLGHTKIAMICRSGYSFSNARVAGYLQALEENGIDRDESLIAHVPQLNPESGMYGMRELMLRNKDFTAVFATTDELAIGAIRTLLDHNFRIAHDVSVLGFDDISISNYIAPRLTTIHQPIAEIGEQAALHLHRFISGQEKPELNLVLPHKLVIRESTAAVSV
ncbi:LacI family DNA-binding transcriptional regulator [Breznakiellaceae bacterium SP9]